MDLFSGLKNCVNLDIYILEIESRMQRIDSLLRVCDSLQYKDGALLYSKLADGIHDLRVLVTKMQIVVEDEKKKLEQYRVLTFFFLVLSYLPLIPLRFNYCELAQT